jgi:hypothetical protein
MELAAIAMGGITVWMTAPKELSLLLLSVYLTALLVMLYFDSDKYTICAWEFGPLDGAFVCKEFKHR